MLQETGSTVSRGANEALYREGGGAVVAYVLNAMLKRDVYTKLATPAKPINAAVPSDPIKDRTKFAMGSHASRSVYAENGGLLDLSIKSLFAPVRLMIVS